MLVSVKRAVLIVNPYSTHVTGKRITAVERALRERVELETEFTQRPGHATELAAAFADRVDAIVVFSGDGTYNEALNGAVGGPVRLPAGRRDERVPARARAVARPGRRRAIGGRRTRRRPRRGASRSVRSTAAGSASRPGSGSTRRQCAG